MIKYLKRCEKSMLISSIITMIIGFILAIEPESSIKILTGVVAVLFIVIGIFQLVDYLMQSKIEKMFSPNLVLSIILLSIGAFILFKIESLVKFITVIIGIAILIKSLFKIQFSINLLNVTKKWFYNLISGLVGIVLGIILLINPFESATLFFRVIGIILSICCIIEIMETLIVYKSFKDYKELDFIDKEENVEVNESEEIKKEVKETSVEVEEVLEVENKVKKKRTKNK